MPMPQVSVVLATHNRSDLLAKSAGSVLAQTYRDLELIVVDDASDEDVQSAVQALDDDRVRYVRRDECGGPAAARNTGLQAARGTYVAFQDSDDEWLLDKLARQVDALRDAGEDVMCICGLLRRLGNRVRAYPNREQTASVSGFENVAALPLTYTQTWLVPRAAVSAAGGFDERLRVWEDWELLLRLTNNVRIHYLSAPLVVSEQASDSVSHDNRSFLDAMSFVLVNHAEAFARHPHLRAGLRHAHARLLINGDQMREARRMLCRALADDPGRGRAWGLLAGSLLGRGFVKARQQAIKRTQGGGT